MKVFIVYAHPSDDSFTQHAKDSFTAGLADAGHEYIVSDLYRMNFTTDMSEAEYLREANYREREAVSSDVGAEQEKINQSDAIAFIYPVFWTEAPAKLVGWFGRVWTYGFAYGARKMKILEKGLVLCVAGHPAEKLAEYGHMESMKTVMLGDRLHDRVKQKEFILLDGMARQDANLRERNWHKHLETSYRAGWDFFNA
jgi:NAD(P)H dehydrogenase (quinone)